MWTYRMVMSRVDWQRCFCAVVTLTPLSFIIEAACDGSMCGDMTRLYRFPSRYVRHMSACWPIFAYAASAATFKF
jgi:hypothetical protein